MLRQIASELPAFVAGEDRKERLLQLLSLLQKHCLSLKRAAFPCGAAVLSIGGSSADFCFGRCPSALRLQQIARGGGGTGCCGHPLTGANPVFARVGPRRLEERLGLHRLNMVMLLEQIVVAQVRLSKTAERFSFKVA